MNILLHDSLQILYKGFKHKRNFSNTIITIQKKSFNKHITYKMSKHNLVDQPAPSNLVLQNQEGELVELKTFIGSGKPSIIFFYPKDETYGCTKEVK
jgi:hypothetical protein